MASDELYLDKRVRERLAAGDAPHGSTHVPGGDEIPGVTSGIVSDPPTGKDKVVNIFYDGDTDEQVIITQ